MTSIQLRHRLIRNYETGPLNEDSDAVRRIEVWKDLHEKTFWVRVYRLMKENGRQMWIIDESSDFHSVREARELTALESTLTRLNQVHQGS